MGNIVDISDALLELGLSGSVTNEERAIVDTAIIRAQAAICRYLGYDPRYGTRTEILPRRARGGPRDIVQEISGDRAVDVDTADSGTALQLTHLPVRSITELYVDSNARSGQAVGGSFPADTLLESGTDYWLNCDTYDSSDNRVCSDGLVWSSGAWSSAPGTIKVVYVAGYTVAEMRGQDTTLSGAPIWEACLDEVTRRVVKAFTVRKLARGWTAGTITSERLGDYAVSYGGTSGSGSAGDRRTGGVYDLLPETTQKLSEFVNWGVRLAGGI